MLMQLGMKLSQHLKQRDSCVVLRGRPTLFLVFVQPCIGNAERVAGRPRLRGHVHGSVGGADRKSVAVLGKRGACGTDDALELALGAVDERTELVAADSVGASVGLDRRPEVTAEARQNRIARRMAKAVVVELEAIEVEENDVEGVW